MDAYLQIKGVRHSFEATVYHASDCKVSKLGCKYIVMHACRLCSLVDAAFADVEAGAQGMTLLHSHDSRPSVSLDNFAKVVTRFLVSTVVSLFLACPGILLNNIHDAACLYDGPEVVWCVLNLQQNSDSHSLLPCLQLLLAETQWILLKLYSVILPPGYSRLPKLASGPT